VNWELSAVPYWPIHRRRIARRRAIACAVVAAVVVPLLMVRAQLQAEPVGQRVFDAVAATVTDRYVDPAFHGIPWSDLVARYRPLVVDAPTTAARYALLRALLAQLGDSHTAVYSPTELRKDEIAAQVPAVTWRNLTSRVGYIRISSFPDKLATAIGWAMEIEGNRPALILDLRSNPGGEVTSVDDAAGAFLPAGTLISTATGRWPAIESYTFTAGSGAGAAYRGSLVVLVDSTTSSGAETLARALQFYRRATIVGTRTAGKVMGVDAEVPLADGGLLRVATMDIRGPDGRPLERRGVFPDDVANGDTAQLRTALRVLSRARS
jgi:C-terminal processing protease CtpA/Prc